MPRSTKKPPYTPEYLLKKVEAMAASGKNHPIKTWARNAMIIPAMIGYIFAVHNGKEFVTVLVTADRVGKKLGEFSITRTFRGHVGDKKGK